MPGNALNSAPTTARICGTTDMSRSTRKIRRARSTDSGPAAGSQAIPTMARSKTFQPLEKNRPRKTQSFNPSSTVKIASAARSKAISSGPAASMTAGQVSSPRVIELMIMTAMIAALKARDSTSDRKRSPISTISPRPRIAGSVSSFTEDYAGCGRAPETSRSRRSARLLIRRCLFKVRFTARLARSADRRMAVYRSA